MKRIRAACICQTLHFMLKEDVAHDWAVKQCEQEFELTGNSNVCCIYSCEQRAN